MKKSEYEALQEALTNHLKKKMQQFRSCKRHADTYEEAVLACKSILSSHQKYYEDDR